MFTASQCQPIWAMLSAATGEHRDSQEPAAA